MLKEMLTQLSKAQISELVGLPLPLLHPPEEGGNADRWLYAFSDYLSGKSTWDRAIERKVKLNELRDAFYYSIEAQHNDVELSERTTTMLKQEWGELKKKIDNKKSELTEKLEKIAPGAVDAMEYAEDLRKEIEDIDFSASFPSTFSEVLDNMKLFEKLRQKKIDCRVICEWAEDEANAFPEHLQKIAKEAFSRLIYLFSKGGKTRQRETEFFLILPSLILKKNVELLEQIADHKSDLNIIELPETIAHKPEIKSRPHILRRISKKAVDPKEVQVHVSLGNFSKTVYNSVRASETLLSSREDYEQLRCKLDGQINYQDKAHQWLGAAKNCKNHQIRHAALGEGLLAYGLRQIDAERYDHARKLLIDSLACLTDSGYYGEQSIERSVLTIICAWIWPQFAATRRNGDSITEWLDSPELMIAQLRNGLFLENVAKIWANYIDQETIAEKFIEVVSANLGNDKILFRLCVKMLLTPYNLLKRTDRAVSGMKWLLKDVAPPSHVLQLIDKLSEEIVIESKGEISDSRLNVLNELVSSLVKELDALPKTTVAPIKEIKDYLPKQLESIAKGRLKRQLKGPKITIQKLLNVLYPNERANDLEFPIIVRNAENAAPASDVAVILRYDSKEGDYQPAIMKNTVDIGDLPPGHQREAIFVMDLPDRLASHLTEWRFKVEIRIASKVQSSGFSVQIQPSTRHAKNSPYIHGPAVSGSSFIGRKKEMQRLMSCLVGDLEQKAAIVYGIRRIGKTSLLKQAEMNEEISRRYYITFWDVEDRPYSDTTVDFLTEFCEQIMKNIPREFHVKFHYNPEAIKERPYTEFGKFMESIDNADLPKRVLLIIDEFDKLLHIANKSSERDIKENRVSKPSEAFQPEVFGAMRKVLMNSSRITFIISGLRTIMKQEYQDRFFGLMDPIAIKAFHRKEAEEVINAGSDVMLMSTEAREMVLNASGMQPYLLQVICNELFHKMKYTGRDMVAPFDVQDVIEMNILPNEKYFTDYDSLIGDDREILYGLALAHHRSKTGNKNYVSVSDVAHELATEGLEYDTEEILQVLTSLRADSSTSFVERPLVERAKNHMRRFRLIIGLLGDHLIRKGVA